MQDLLKKPIRMRLLGWLAGNTEPRTQSEIGKALCLSNAAVHYHLNLLVDAGLLRLTGTRPGPNGITEKLYAAVMTPPASGHPSSILQSSEFYLNYTLQSIQEMHREAATILADSHDQPHLLVGCYESYATPEELNILKRKLATLLADFHQHHKTPGKNRHPLAITFGLLPSQGAGWTGAQRVLDNTPE